MRKIFAVVAAFLVLLGPASAHAELVDFAGQPDKETPAGMSVALTGQGEQPVWQIQSLPGGKGKAVVQTTAVPVDYRYPLLILDRLSAADVRLSVKFRAVSGKIDQAAGLVWRYVDNKNYYLVRANALEDNVVLYKVENGRRIDLPVVGKGRTYGAHAPVSKTDWNTLAVDATGDLFSVSLNGKPLYEVQDKTFMRAGKIGLWTKADSVMMFTDLDFIAVK